MQTLAEDGNLSILLIFLAFVLIFMWFYSDSLMLGGSGLILFVVALLVIPLSSVDTGASIGQALQPIDEILYYFIRNFLNSR